MVPKEGLLTPFCLVLWNHQNNVTQNPRNPGVKSPYIYRYFKFTDSCLPPMVLSVAGRLHPASWKVLPSAGFTMTFNEKVLTLDFRTGSV
jgi:hypothetical protein